MAQKRKLNSRKSIYKSFGWTVRKQGTFPNVVVCGSGTKGGSIGLMTACRRGDFTPCLLTSREAVRVAGALLLAAGHEGKPIRAVKGGLR